MNKQFTNPIIIGVIGAPFGILGWVRLFSFTEKIENIFKYQPWFIQISMKLQYVEIENWKNSKYSLIIKFKGFNDRNKAQILNNCNVIVESLRFPKLEDGNYYWKDLINCQIVTTKGYKLGNIIGIIETGSNDVMVIKKNLKDKVGIKKHLIPFITGQVIKKIDLITHIIEVDWDPNF
ncbi:ribosome maturation factor RimM [Candidatus Profftia sp. (ex Adelges kitamiensis)]|uniref:ribosome maturation factor RimM n=1 Tax=Candidatus Profftia sp. (ex Adelges kitamiensis) TaxID=2864218 RepID=UPI001CE37699|nr:ribosome maturation factor RimM [Candidatus Profftia sp. (ex Adelges kitamiensis)]